MIKHSSINASATGILLLLLVNIHYSPAIELGEKEFLPDPYSTSDTSIEESLWNRRTVRSYSSQSLSWEQIGQLLWAAQGINRPGTNYRTAPSAWAIYPLSIYIAHESGVYKYITDEHVVQKMLEEDVRGQLTTQSAEDSASCLFIFSAEFEKMTVKDSEKGTGFVYLECGHAVQNLVIQGMSLGLYGVTMGGINRETVRNKLGLTELETPIYVIPIGYPNDSQAKIITSTKFPDRNSLNPVRIFMNPSPSSPEKPSTTIDKTVVTDMESIEFSSRELNLGETYALPDPLSTSDTSVEESLWNRRTVRYYTNQSLTWDQIGQLLWAAQGINRPGTNHRTAPSAYAVYPLSIYLVHESGVYKYITDDHAVLKVLDADVRSQITTKAAPCLFVFCCEFEEMIQRDSAKGTGFVYLECGHATQNLVLQGTSLGLYGVTMGGINRDAVQNTLELNESEIPVYVIPIGYLIDEQTNINTPDYFPDLNFLNSVRDFMNPPPAVPEDPFTAADAAKKTGTFNCCNLGISDLTGIEYFTGVDSFDCSFNQLTDISNLVTNIGLGAGDIVDVRNNNLTCDDWLDILTLQNRIGTGFTFSPQNGLDPFNCLQRIEDVNNDYVVNILDLVVISIYFGRQVNDTLDPVWNSIGDGSEPDLADVNDDGVVNILDMVLVSIAFD